MASPAKARGRGAVTSEQDRRDEADLVRKLVLLGVGGLMRSAACTAAARADVSRSKVSTHVGAARRVGLRAQPPLGLACW